MAVRRIFVEALCSPLTEENSHFVGKEWGENSVNICQFFLQKPKIWKIFTGIKKKNFSILCHCNIYHAVLRLASRGNFEILWFYSIFNSCKFKQNQILFTCHHQVSLSLTGTVSSSNSIICILTKQGMLTFFLYIYTYIYILVGGTFARQISQNSVAMQPCQMLSLITTNSRRIERQVSAGNIH